jgi:hypothetical protein
MTRSGLSALRLGSLALVLGLLGWFGSEARAQVTFGSASGGALPGGATIDQGIFYMHEIANPMTNNGVNDAPPLKQPDSFWTYFNFAHCVCDEPATRGFPDPTGNSLDPNKHETTYGQQLLLHNRTIAVAVPLEFWSGAGCSDLTSRDMVCSHMGYADLTSVDQLNPSGVIPEVHIFDIMTPEPDLHASGVCTPRPLTGDEWLLVSTMNNGTFDYSEDVQIITDGQPPPIPTSLKAESGEGAIQLSWSMPDGDLTDIKYFQALCVDTTTGAPGNTPDSGPLYQTARTLCGDLPADSTREISWKVIAGNGDDTNVGPDIAPPQIFADAGTGDDAGVDGGVVISGASDPLPAGTSPNIAQLNSAFICKTSTDQTATSLRIEGLTNGHSYNVALLTIDKSGNPAGIYVTTPQLPALVTDFWEGLHDDGSKVQGGFCLLSGTYGDDSGLTNALRAFRDDSLGSNVFGRWLTKLYYQSFGNSYGSLGAYVHGSLALRIYTGVILLPFVAIALLWHFLTLPGLLALIGLVVVMRRFRRRVLHSRLVGAAVAGTLLFIAHSAHADPLRPYWEDEIGQDQQGAQAADDAQPASHWQAGVKVGPYTPQIDAQLGKNPGPYAAAFGGYTLMPTIDVDRFLWSNYVGQVGIGISIGYMGKSAHAFQEGVDVNDPHSPRSPGDTTGFHMIPTAITATYRLTYLDETYGIPIVPYVRGGFSYYIWWMNSPSGGYARVCSDPTVMEPCVGSSQDVAKGASAGVQGSIGFAVRAERIDENAASSMRDSGILHVGFYAELELAKVNGFGSESKLDVGDTTWFAGVNFEF